LPAVSMATHVCR